VAGSDFRAGIPLPFCDETEAFPQLHEVSAIKQIAATILETRITSSSSAVYSSGLET
jgi:hypothetical protein